MMTPSTTCGRKALQSTKASARWWTTYFDRPQHFAKSPSLKQKKIVQIDKDCRSRKNLDLGCAVNIANHRIEALDLLRQTREYIAANTSEGFFPI
jgi:hypothetical protein